MIELPISFADFSEFSSISRFHLLVSFFWSKLNDMELGQYVVSTGWNHKPHSHNRYDRYENVHFFDVSEYSIWNLKKFNFFHLFSVSSVNYHLIRFISSSFFRTPVKVCELKVRSSKSSFLIRYSTSTRSPLE